MPLNHKILNRFRFGFANWLHLIMTIMCGWNYKCKALFRPHCPFSVSPYVDMVHCYRPSSMVCRLVLHTSEPSKNSWTDRDAVWVEDSGGPREPCIRWCSRFSHGKGQFWGVWHLSRIVYHWAHMWINHWSLWHIASAIPDLRLPSQL